MQQYLLELRTSSFNSSLYEAVRSNVSRTRPENEQRGSKEQGWWERRWSRYQCTQLTDGEDWRYSKVLLRLGLAEESAAEAYTVCGAKQSMLAGTMMLG